MIARSTPSLRIARFVVEGFRTFRERTEIPLSDEGGPADEVATFHGPNGSGKSNALAALEQFFRGTATWLGSEANPANRPGKELSRLRFAWRWRHDITGFELNHRNWPPGSREPQRVTVHFEDPGLLLLSLSLTPAGNEVYIDFDRYVSAPEGIVLDGTRMDRSAADAFARLGTALLTPLGPGSAPFFRLGARRSHARSLGGQLDDAGAGTLPLSLPMAERLYALATSEEPEELERWRAFAALVHRFKTLERHELSIVPAPRGASRESPIDLRFEIRGKQILRLSELSSGEQQVVALCAAVLTSRAAVVAIEEPEISLHPSYQTLLREILAEQVQNGVVDQVILESHSHMFDNGPRVVHFARTDEDGIPSTRVERQGSRKGDAEIREKARAQGADERWVTRDGFTQLPDQMREELQVAGAGGPIWFLPSDTTKRWEAWRADEVDAFFGDRGEGDPGEKG